MIRIEEASIETGNFLIENVSLYIPQGAYAVLMGKTGSGKTTIMEAICGLRRLKRGKIILNGRDVSELPPAERRIGFLPQDQALFQSMTIEEHLAFGPKVQNWSAKLVKQRVDELAEKLDIGALLKRKPFGLSGGEGQRVALARALAAKPDILCLDEPLTALDEETRSQVCELIKSVTADEAVTTLHITHQRADIYDLATKLFKLEGRRIKELESPQG